MKKTFYLLLLIYCFETCFGQKKYPQNEFRNPLDIPIVLAGTFGELRTNHFHAGIDIKTNRVTGKKVYTAKKGYVSRIKISLWGYGKALYITHPNGYTTVYGHLKKFSKKIEAYIRKQQYKRKSFEIQVFPNKDLLPVADNEVIAYSGNTGGSSAPHLHFEIRDTKTEKTINPLLFGYPVKDNIYPTVKGLRATPFGKNSAINKITASQEIKLKKVNNHLYIAEQIQAIGKIGLSVSTHDLLNNANNKNGVYSIDMYVGDSLFYHHRLETFAFSESKYINLLIDYPFYAKKYKKYQKTYIENANKLSIYKKQNNTGYIKVKKEDNFNVSILIKDIVGNTTTVKIPIKAENTILPIIKKDFKTPYYIDKNKYTIFKKENTELRFGKNTFYENVFIDYQVNQNKITVHKPILPLNKSYTLSFFTKHLSKLDKKYAYFSRKKGKKYNYVNTVKKEDKIYTNTKHLGNFYIRFDSIAPKIYKPNFYQNQNVLKHQYLSVYIKDIETGIKNYYATIDNKWVLMEYNPKKNKLSFDLSTLKTSNTKHFFKLKIEDLLGNSKIFTSSFIK